MKSVELQALLFENRSESRFKLHMECAVFSNGVPVQGGRLQTMDISKSGVAIQWGAGDEPPAVGQALTIEIRLPENPRFGTKCMYFQTEVVRVTKTPEGGLLVAAKAKKSGFRSALPRRRGAAANRYVN